MARKPQQEARQDILIQAFLTCPSVSEVSRQTGVPRSTIYTYLKNNDFQEKLSEARQEAVKEAVAYLQGNLAECSKILMEIVRDEETAPQVRINAINSVFLNAKGLTKDSGLIAGLAVKIIDSIE